MIRGVLIAVILFAGVDLCFNQGQVVHHVVSRLTEFGSASSEAIHGSIFRR